MGFSGDWANLGRREGRRSRAPESSASMKTKQNGRRASRSTQLIDKVSLRRRRASAAPSVGLVVTFSAMMAFDDICGDDIKAPGVADQPLTCICVSSVLNHNYGGGGGGGGG